MNNAKVLVVDDEHAIRRFLRTSLGAHGYTILEASSGKEALTMFTSHQPDIVILDLGLPDLDGIAVTQHLREWTQTPIIILSVQDQDKDKIAALDAGADDYLTKPFSLGELMARMRVAMRHATKTAPDDPIFIIGELKIDLNSRVVTLGDEEIQLTPTEYDLLRVLVNHSGKVLTHQQLLREVRGVGYQTETHLLRVHMSNLRRKLEKDPTSPNFIITEPGVGYRLKSDM